MTKFHKHADLFTIADEVAANYVNGNIKDAKATLEGLPPLAAAEVVFHTLPQLTAQQRRHFMSTLARWNGW